MEEPGLRRRGAGGDLADGKLTARERAIADYAIKISRAPAETELSDVEGLRSVGLREREILEAAGVAAYFNFSNRVNSALGVHPNPEPFHLFR
ncbi:MAG: carboxymuconolactone decarboxylase family protein [Xanthobacteraceae bacterium]